MEGLKSLKKSRVKEIRARAQSWLLKTFFPKFPTMFLAYFFPVLLTTNFVFIIAFITTPTTIDIYDAHKPIYSCDKWIRGSLITTHNP